MNLYLLRNLPDRVKKEDIENAFAGFGSVEYLKIKHPSPSGRMVVIKMAKIGGGTLEIKRRHGREDRERLRLVTPRSEKTRRGELEKTISKENNKMTLIARAVQHFLRSLRMLQSLPEKVRVKR